MFEDFFENNAPADEEKPDEARTGQIKAAVMQRISQANEESEEKNMKHRVLRPFVIAAAVAAVGAGSLVTANAATNGAVADTFTKAFSVFISIDGEQAEAKGEMSEIVMEDGSTASVLTFDLPDDAVNGVAVAVEGDDDPAEFIFRLEKNGADGEGAEISSHIYDGENVTPVTDEDISFTR